MGRESNYFPLSLESLRALGSWAADCAERALSVYETYADSDPRPRAAIEGIRVFAAGGKRTAQLRALALSAYSAAREADDPAAVAAARAAGLAASSAYTPTHIPWPMSSKQSTLSARQPMLRWRLNSTTLAIQTSVMARFAGQSNTSPLKCASSCTRCPPVKRAAVGWTSSCMS